MNRPNLLGNLFLRASSITGGATFADLIEEIRKLSRKKTERRVNTRKSHDVKTDHPHKDDHTLKAA